MKNKSLEMVKSKIKISVKGKNVNRYLLRLSKNHIPLLFIKKISREESHVTIYFKDYEKAEKLNTIYDIHIIEYGGWEKEKKSLLKNKWIVIAIFLSLLLLFVLSKMIFEVEVVTNDKEMKSQLLEELKEYQIDKFHFQKSYQQLQFIKEQILENHHDDIEWLEIESIGTKYRIRYEPRIVKQEEEVTGYRHVIASKNAIIKKVESSTGQILKGQNDYVKKGDIIVSGYITLNDEIKETVSASATVYGEVWYEVEVFYPFGIYEQTKTGNVKEVYVLQFLNHRIELFNFHPFYDKIINNTILLEKQGFPVYFLKESQEEVVTNSAIYTVEEAKEKGVLFAISKMESQLEELEKIENYKVIKEEIEEDGVRLTIFFSVYENITDYIEIAPYVEEGNEENNR